jgi:hypothetical protein
VKKRGRAIIKGGKSLTPLAKAISGRAATLLKGRAEHHAVMKAQSGGVLWKNMYNTRIREIYIRKIL